MKTIAIFITLFAVSLAAPAELSTAEEKSVVPEKTQGAEKLIEKDVAAGPSSDSSNVEKVVAEGEAAPPKEVASPEEKPPVVVIATSVEEEKTDEEKDAEKEKENDKQQNSEICRASTGATQEQITAIGEDPGDNAPNAVKCYIRCMAEAYGIEKDQVLQRDAAFRKKPSTITTEEFETAIETCADLKTDDPCDSAYLRYSCYFRTTDAKIRLH